MKLPVLFSRQHRWFSCKFNFGPVAANEKIVHAGSRPGVGKEFESNGRIGKEEIAEWSKFMKTKGMKRILCLLSPDELKWYKEPYEKMLSQHGFPKDKVSMVNMSASCAFSNVKNALENANAVNEPIVIHCSNGGGRAGLASSVWMHCRYKLPPPDACEIVVSYADQIGTKRRADLTKLNNLLKEESST